MTEVEKDKVRLEFDRMMEEGRGRTIHILRVVTCSRETK